MRWNGCLDATQTSRATDFRPVPVPSIGKGRLLQQEILGEPGLLVQKNEDTPFSHHTHKLT
jgi:hypothetical protein